GAGADLRYAGDFVYRAADRRPGEFRCIPLFGPEESQTKEWDAPNDIYGALVPIYGTLVTSFIALLIAVP
ncbi:hypothetical protein ACUOFC_68675, partial [Escherichia sp. TWPC-MK]